MKVFWAILAVLALGAAVLVAMPHGGGGQPAAGAAGIDRPQANGAKRSAPNGKRAPTGAAARSGAGKPSPQPSAPAASQVAANSPAANAGSPAAPAPAAMSPEPAKPAAAPPQPPLPPSLDEMAQKALGESDSPAAAPAPPPSPAPPAAKTTGAVGSGPAPGGSAPAAPSPNDKPAAAPAATTPADKPGGAAPAGPTAIAADAPSAPAPAAASAAMKVVTRDDGSVLVDDRYVVKGKGTKAEPYEITWDFLLSAQEVYKPRLGQKQLPDRLNLVKDKWVRITGFIAFPIMAQEPDEMMVMLNQWDGCCIGVPPTPYDAIEVKLAAPAEREDRLIVHGSVTGKLGVEPYLVKDWLIGLYTMDGATMKGER